MVPCMYHKTHCKLPFWPKNCKNHPKTPFFDIKIVIKKVWTTKKFWKLACTFLLGLSKIAMDKKPMNIPPLPRNRKKKFWPKKSVASSPIRRGKSAKIYQYFFVENQISVTDGKIKSWKNPIFTRLFGKKLEIVIHAHSTSLFGHKFWSQTPQTPMTNLFQLMGYLLAPSRAL